jgi:hypothetical protein
MAQRIVDRLEVVEVDAEHGGHFAPAEAGLGLAAICSRNCDAVGQVGQGVVPREVADARLVLPLLGDVFVRTDPAAILHRMVLHHDGAVIEFVDVLAVLARD